MHADIILIISFIGIASHLYMEAKYFCDWKEGRAIFPNAGIFNRLPLKISCIGIVTLYGLVVFLEIYINNDITRTLILAAQGAILLNFLVHFALKFVWKINMPCFWSSFFFGLTSCIVVSQLAFSTSWFSTFLTMQIFLYGMLFDVIFVIISLSLASALFVSPAKAKVNNWENF